jgi:hypothetical protein
MIVVHFEKKKVSKKRYRNAANRQREDTERETNNKIKCIVKSRENDKTVRVEIIHLYVTGNKNVRNKTAEAERNQACEQKGKSG